MTDIKWGTSIPHKGGGKPVWLQPDEVAVGIWGAFDEGVAKELPWPSISTFHLPADHWAYPVIEKGFTPHDGRHRGCPVDFSTKVDVILRDGTIAKGYQAYNWAWIGATPHAANIIGWRLHEAPDAEEPPEETHTGGSSDYYSLEIGGQQIECGDIIDALKLTFNEGCEFKAIWRTATARLGKRKKGNTALYDAEKRVYYAERCLEIARREDKMHNE